MRRVAGNAADDRELRSKSQRLLRAATGILVITTIALVVSWVGLWMVRRSVREFDLGTATVLVVSYALIHVVAALCLGGAACVSVLAMARDKATRTARGYLTAAAATAMALGVVAYLVAFFRVEGP